MFCGLGDQVSYDGLVNNFLNLTISKESQFSNWLQRPLTNKQIRLCFIRCKLFDQNFPINKKNN